MLPEIGLEGQQRLLESAALIIGAGGLGSPVALYLAAAGVGRLGLCDTDTVSEEEIGRQKTECAARRLGALRSDLRCTLHPEGLNAENAAAIASGYDIVIDCCDNFATRYLIDDTCRALGKPWVHGTIGGFDGRVTTFLPGAESGFADLYPEREELCARGAAAGGVLGAVPGAIGAIQACEALKVLGRFGRPLSGRMLVVNFSDNLYNIISF